ncbi:glycosyltransferase [soil metagenome]
MTQILAILVLYKMRAEDSPAFQAITRFMRSEQAPHLRLLVSDNTPHEQPAPMGFSGDYLRNPDNPGLAKPYNHALHLAEESGAGWLMLLDQDTTVTPEYLEEVLVRTTALETDATIGALVPRLMMGRRRLSPHPARFQKLFQTFESELPFPAGEPFEPYNSGAVFRVSALRDIGGFPERFWLDYLDHATFYALREVQRSILILDAELQHDLSGKNENSSQGNAYSDRLENILDAGLSFYQEHGSLKTRILYRMDLMRQVLGTLKRGWFYPAFRILKVAVRLAPHRHARPAHPHR